MPVFLEGSVSGANLLSTGRSTNGKQIFFTQNKHLITVAAEVRLRSGYIFHATASDLRVIFWCVNTGQPERLSVFRQKLSR